MDMTTNHLPRGMFPTLVDTLGDGACAIDEAIAAHELIDIQRAQIAEYQQTIDAQRARIREMESLTNHAAGLARDLADESRVCDYFRDEAIMNAAHLAQIDNLLSAVGIEDAPTIERVSALINLWLHAEVRAQGLAVNIMHVATAPVTCCVKEQAR